MGRLPSPVALRGGELALTSIFGLIYADDVIGDKIGKKRPQPEELAS